MSRQDQGWAWLIVFAVMLQNFFVVGLLKSFGLLFVEFQYTFEASASMTSAVLGVQAAAFCIAAPVCLHYCSTKVSYRTLMFCGAMTSSTGIAMSFAATDMGYLIFSCGVLIGVGNAFMHGPSLVMIGQYFKKRLSFANGIAIGGGSLGQFAFPPLVHVLFEHYSLRGTLLVIGGLMLNCCVSASLMRPFKNENLVPERTQGESDDVCECKYGKDMKNMKVEKEEIRSLVVGKGKEVTELNDERICLEKNFEENSNSDTIEETGGKAQHKTRDNRQCFLPALVDFSLCRNPIFILLEIASALGNAGSTLHTIYLVPHARDIGVDEGMTSIMVTVIGAADIVGKLLCGWFADTGLLKRYKLLAMSMLVSGSLAHFLVFFNSTESIIVYCVLVGMIGGFYNSLLSPVLVDFLGIDNLPRSLGITLCCEGVANTVTPVLLGYLRDSTNSYFASFHLIGMFLIAASLSLLSTKVVKMTCASYISSVT